MNNNESLLRKIKLDDDTEYITSASRIAEFRRIHPNHSLISEVISITNEMVVIQSKVLSGNQVISTGLCGKTIHSDHDISACETISKGRAIGFFGIGISPDAIASAEEMKSVTIDQKLKSPAPSREDRVVESLQEKLNENDGRKSKK